MSSNISFILRSLDEKLLFEKAERHIHKSKYISWLINRDIFWRHLVAFIRSYGTTFSKLFKIYSITEAPLDSLPALLFINCEKSIPSFLIFSNSEWLLDDLPSLRTYNIVNPRENISIILRLNICLGPSPPSLIETFFLIFLVESNPEVLVVKLF